MSSLVRDRYDYSLLPGIFLKRPSLFGRALCKPKLIISTGRDANGRIKPGQVCGHEPTDMRCGHGGKTSYGSVMSARSYNPLRHLPSSRGGNDRTRRGIGAEQT